MKKKLELKKEIISNLNSKQMNSINGGLFKTRLWCSNNCATIRDPSECTICGTGGTTIPDPIDTVCADGACSAKPSLNASECGC